MSVKNVNLKVSDVTDHKKCSLKKHSLLRSASRLAKENYPSSEINKSAALSMTHINARIDSMKQPIIKFLNAVPRNSGDLSLQDAKGKTKEELQGSYYRTDIDNADQLWYVANGDDMLKKNFDNAWSKMMNGSDKLTKDEIVTQHIKTFTAKILDLQKNKMHGIKMNEWFAFLKQQSKNKWPDMEPIEGTSPCFYGIKAETVSPTMDALGMPKPTSRKAKSPEATSLKRIKLSIEIEKKADNLTYELINNKVDEYVRENSLKLPTTAQLQNLFKELISQEQNTRL